jgi:hypothetical protein
MINDPSVFKPLGETNMRISTGGHSNYLQATAVGSAVLVNHNGDQLVLENALLVTNLNQSLILIPRLFDHTFHITKYENRGAVVDVDKGFLLNGTVKRNLLELLDAHFLPNAIESLLSCYLSSPVSPDWHAWLGHPSAKYQQHLIPGSVSSECNICKECKMKALPFSSHFKKAETVLEAVHIDLVGPLSTQSRSGYSYFLTIIDQHSGFCTVKFLRNKSNTFARFKEFKAKAERQTGSLLCMLVSNGGGEFLNDNFKDLCASEGIIHHVLPAYSPPNNGMAEQANQTILVKARCLLAQLKLPKSFWEEAVNTATQLSNLTPSVTRKMSIPYEIWTGRKVNLDVLRPFGCLIYCLIPKKRRTFKLLPTGEKGLFLGYENDFSSYRVYKLNERKFVRVRNITFDESSFPGLKEHTDEDTTDVFDFPSQTAPTSPEDPATNQFLLSNNTPISAESPNPDVSILATKAPKDISSEISTDNILNVDQRGNQVLVYLTENVKCDTPISYIQAINSENSTFWKKAIEKEITNMYEHDVWVIVKKESNQKRINCTWVFKVKKDQLNIPIEYKARLCAKGFQKTKGIDYWETYAPTGKLVSLCMLIVFALKRKLSFHQIDIKSAFLNAPLTEDIFLNPPPGVDIPGNKVLKLKKAMYGLKQAPNAWHCTLTEWLGQIGFKRCDAKPCVFWRKGTFLYLHVDDLAIFSKNPKGFKDEVQTRFKIKDLGKSNLLLGMNVIQEADSVTLTQRHYINTQLERFGCQHLYPASTPMKPNSHLVKSSRQEQEAHLESGNNYRSLVGALNYLSVTTRPDITFAVSSLSQYLNEPGSAHWDSGIQVLRYLKGTKDIGLHFQCNNSAEDSLVGYADADWASCPESWRSVSGNLVLLNGNVISWKSKKQPTLSL